MGKTKKRKLPAPQKATKTNPSQPKSKPKQPIQPTQLTIPFSPADRILLIGEGDFSFTTSLLRTHGCTSLLATSYDTQSELIQKYPQARENIAYIEEQGQRVLYGVDAKKLGAAGGGGGGGGGGREVTRKGEGGWERVVWNFPHVGGLTRDVNRQVRYNQGGLDGEGLKSAAELLVAFFKAAVPLLAPGGTIAVTIFEGEPYELWNIKDLARHVGLKVGRSFKFQSAAYPGYKHARTLGNIEGGGGWHGESRSARTYIFEVNGGDRGQKGDGTKKKRKRNDSTDDEAD
ncbi:MAG: hypothetical protein M1830_003346 [Pleopsidium flavum]|nr:MAG: hypothetical protein M1830_003346 [Pleopsidium flavum]